MRRFAMLALGFAVTASLVAPVASSAQEGGSPVSTPPREPGRPGPPPRPAKPSPGVPRGPWVPGELLVKFRDSVPRDKARGVHAAVGARLVERIRGGLDVDVVRLPPGLSVPQAVREYDADPAVEYAEPNFYRFRTQEPPLPDDTGFGSLWGLHNDGIQAHPVTRYDGTTLATAVGTLDADMDVPDAWGDPRVQWNNEVIVGVLDSGVDVFHVDLDGNLWENPDPDDDSDDCANDLNGCDFTVEPEEGGPNGSDLLEDEGVLGFDHGTHVAGTIAAVANNGVGVAGVCGGDGSEAMSPVPGCRLMVLKFMHDGGDGMVGTVKHEVLGINYAKAKGAHIINGSFGAWEWSRTERNAIRNAPDILFVFAAGNWSEDNDIFPIYPASYNLPNILSVAASNHHDEYAYSTACAAPEEDSGLGLTKSQCAFTNYGRYSVDVAAPGTDVLSTVPGDGYTTFDGTSMAAPHASGVAGLLKSVYPDHGPVDIKNMIMNSADRSGLSLNTTMFTPWFAKPKTGRFTRTAGRVNALAALDGSTADASPNHDGDVPGARRMRQSVTGSVAWPNDVNDVFKKRLVQGQKYAFHLTVPDGRDFDLYLWEPGAVEIWQPNRFLKASLSGVKGRDESFTYRARTTGMHYVHVSSFFSPRGSYRLRARCVTC